LDLVKNKFISDKGWIFEDIEINSFDGVENGYDEPTVIHETDPNEGL